VFQIQDEQVSGTLPPGWAQELPHLRRLSLGSLQLQGALPPEWGAWGSLRHLWIFSCQVRASASPKLGKPEPYRVKAKGGARNGFAPTSDDGARGADGGWTSNVAFRASSACASSRSEVWGLAGSDAEPGAAGMLMHCLCTKQGPEPWPCPQRTSSNSGSMRGRTHCAEAAACRGRRSAARCRRSGAQPMR